MNSIAAAAGLEVAPGLVLMSHQQAGIEWLRERSHALLADDPGLGKTAQALLAATPPVLVIAPAMLAGTWRSEVARWRPEWTEADWSWTSYSSLCYRMGHAVFARPRDEFDRPWSTVICDEAHYLKNRKAKWTQAAMLVCGQAERVFLLTGTPVPNWAHELYMLLRILHPGDARFRSYWRWVGEWFELAEQKRRDGRSWQEVGGLKAGIGWRSFARENDLDELMLRRRREDVLADLPPLTETTIEVPMTAAQRTSYVELRQEYYTWMRETGEEVAAFSEGELHVRLAQTTTGLSTLFKEPERGESGKLEALAELLEEREGAPVVVFTHFRATAEAVADLARKAHRRTAVIMGGVTQAERDLYVEDFQAGRIDLLVGTLATLAEGVTLTRSSTCIFVERSWRPSTNEQAMRRVHRISQTTPVTCIYIVTADSLDQRMTERLAAKGADQTGVLTAADFARLL